MKTPTGTSDTTAPSPPKKRTGPITFIRQVNAEARKVTWTRRNETIAATIMVVVMVVLAAVFFYLTDAIVTFLVNLLTGAGTITNG